MPAQYIHLNDSGSQEETQRFGKKQVLGGFLIGLAFGCVFALSYGGQETMDATSAIDMPAALRSQQIAMQPAAALRGTSIIAQSGGKRTPAGAKTVGGYVTPGGDDTIRNNLEGTSRYMSKKGWVDPQGREGKGYGVYRFSGKYGTNVDGYSPIYSPDEWSETGESFTLGIKGLLAWGALVVTLLGIGGYLVFSTSQLGN